MSAPPIEVYAQLLKTSDVTPAHAADVLRQYMAHSWSVDSFVPSAPRLMQAMWDARAWERFFSSNPVTQKEIAAHCLFSAASHLPPEDQAAINILRETALSLVSEIVNSWLKDRDSNHP